jgi:hypothetical protein
MVQKPIITNRTFAHLVTVKIQLVVLFRFPTLSDIENLLFLDNRLYIYI